MAGARCDRRAVAAAARAHGPRRVLGGDEPIREADRLSLLAPCASCRRANMVSNEELNAPGWKRGGPRVGNDEGATTFIQMEAGLIRRLLVDRPRRAMKLLVAHRIIMIFPPVAAKFRKLAPQFPG